MKDFDEQDDLWQLLGKAKKSAVSPLFSRNVLREVRQSQQERPGILSWLRIRWRVASLGGIAAVLLALNVVVCKTASTPSAGTNIAQVAAAQPPEANAPQIAGNIANTIKPEDTEVIKHLDELLAYEENNIWLDDSGK